METKFNFNSQICTTREQSELLLELGLKKETADMFYAAIHNGTKVVGYRVSPEYNEHHYEIFTDDIPAWSLGRLLEIMRMKASSQVVPLDNTFDRLIDGIEKRIKDGYFNKEYLIKITSQGTTSIMPAWMVENGIL